MPSGGIDGLKDRLGVKQRMDSARTFVDDLRDDGVWTAFTGIAQRFGRNNRRLVKGR